MRRGEERKKDEERAIVRTAAAAPAWTEVEGGGRWAVDASRNNILDSPPVVVCVFPGHSGSNLLPLEAQAKLCR